MSWGEVLEKVPCVCAAVSVGCVVVGVGERGVHLSAEVRAGGRESLETEIVEVGSEGGNEDWGWGEEDGLFGVGGD